MNQVANRAGSAVAALASLKTGLQNVQRTLIVKGGDPYLRLLTDGSWVYGQEDVEVENGSQWACNPLSITHGWVCWDRSKGADNSKGPLGETMVPSSQPIPIKSSLEDFGHDWVQQIGINMKCLNGTDEGEQVLYKTNSNGGINFMDDLLKAIGRQLELETEAVVPVIVLKSDSYKHPTYGRTYFPVLDIVKWVSFDGLKGAASEPAVEPVKEPKPVKATRTRKASVPEVKPAADADDELAAMEAEIARRKAAKDAAAKAAAEPAESDAARRKRELLAQLAELDDAPANEAVQAAAVAAVGEGQPLRRRRA